MKNIIISALFLSLSMTFFFHGKALAHQTQIFEIGHTNYQFTVGSLNEPIYVDDKTGVSLSVSIPSGTESDHGHGGSQGAVTGLENSLKVEVAAGDESKVFDLRPAYGVPGEYSAPFYPTVATTYSYRFFGAIDGVDVDLTFTCNPAGHVAEPAEDEPSTLSEGVVRISKSGSFGCPQERTDVSFPEIPSSATEITSKTEELNSEVKGLQTKSNVGLIAGILGLAAGGFALYKSKRK